MKLKNKFTVKIKTKKRDIKNEDNWKRVAEVILSG